MSDELDKYRQQLIEFEQKIGAGYDKTLIALSGGALGISISFVKDIVGDKEVLCPLLALIAWGSWATSLACLLLAFYFGTNAYRYAIRKLDAGNLNPANPGGCYAILTAFFNALGGISFIVGVILFVYFAYKNIGG